MVDLKREMEAMVALMRDSRVKAEGQSVEINVSGQPIYLELAVPKSPFSERVCRKVVGRLVWRA